MVGTLRAGACAVVVMAFTPLADASVMWSNDSGVAMNFTWANGGSDNGLYGDPTLVGGSTLVFFPTAFRAESVDGVNSSVTDRLFVDIFAKAGQMITDIVISETGDYGVVGSASINLSAIVNVTDLLDPLRTDSAFLVTTPSMPTASGTGNWDAFGSLSFSVTPGQEWTHIRLELTNTLEAFSAAGSSSFIEKKVAGTGIQVTIIPAPGSGGVLLLAGLALARRRRG